MRAQPRHVVGRQLQAGRDLLQRLAPGRVGLGAERDLDHIEARVLQKRASCANTSKSPRACAARTSAAQASIVPPLAPAFANAIAKLTGQRMREMPFRLA
jgi:hypothetical protein